MPNYLHPNFVMDQSAYDACKAFWAGLFTELAGPYEGADLWNPFWEGPIITGDGTVLDPINEWMEFGAVSPILGRVSPDRNRGVKVLQLVGEEDIEDHSQQSPLLKCKLERVPWQTPWTDCDLEMLNIIVALAEENAKDLKTVMSLWLDPATSYSDMDKFLRDIEVARK